MKKTLTLLLLAMLSISGFAKGDLDNQFYIRGGICRPTWKTGFADGKKDWKFGNEKAPKRKGWVFEMGSIFMLNSIPLADGMRIGINADYLSLYNAKFEFENNSQRNTFFFGSKLGPSFTYSPVSNLEIDVFAKVHPVWLAITTYKLNDETLGDAMDERGYEGAFVKLKSSFGLNVRYSVAMLGFDFCPGRMMTYSYDIEDGKSDEPEQEDDENPRYSTFNVTLGLSF